MLPRDDTLGRAIEVTKILKIARIAVFLDYICLFIFKDVQFLNFSSIYIKCNKNQVEFSLKTFFCREALHDNMTQELSCTNLLIIFAVKGFDEIPLFEFISFPFPNKILLVHVHEKFYRKLPHLLENCTKRFERNLNSIYFLTEIVIFCNGGWSVK